RTWPSRPGRAWPRAARPSRAGAWASRAPPPLGVAWRSPGERWRPLAARDRLGLLGAPAAGPPRWTRLAARRPAAPNPPPPCPPATAQLANHPAQLPPADQLDGHRAVAAVCAWQQVMPFQIRS